MLLGKIGTSLLGNMLSGKLVIIAGEGTARIQVIMLVLSSQRSPVRTAADDDLNC